MNTSLEQHVPRLCDFIRQGHERILDEWARRVQTLSVARNLSRSRLLDHLPELLKRVADVVETVHGPPASLSELPKLHALDRLDRGFDLKEVADEYGLLRQCVLDLYEAAHGPTIRVREVQRLNAAIDETIRESVYFYAEQRSRILTAVDRLTTSSPAGLPLPELLQRLLDVFIETSAAVDTSTILLLEGGRLRVRASIGLSAEVEAGFSLAIGDGFSGTIAARGEPLTLRHASQDPLVKSPHLKASGLRALYGVPLVYNDELLGVAHMGSRTAFEFSDEDRSLFRVLTTRAAAFIHQALLQSERRAAEEQFRALADNIPQLAWIADGNGDIYWYNRRWFEYTGTTLDEVKGWGWQAVHHPEHVERVVKKIRHSFESGQPWEDLFPLRGKDGGYRWFLSRAQPIRDDDGRIIRWFGTNTDVTEQRRLDEAREQFIGILGHDLRNPLNAITMTAGILERHGDETVTKASRRIEASALRMRMMIADLLDFTRGRLGGGIPIAAAPTDFRAVAAGVLDEIAVAHPGTRITLDVEGDVNGYWDGARLAQIVQNLTINAIQHGDASAGIRVVIDGRDANEVLIRVTNFGSTIPEEVVPHLFEPFRRLAQEASGSTSLGLGLFIVSEIARAHRGSVAVRSADASGTSFEVRLPRAALQPVSCSGGAAEA